jgi:hypothetical protein
MIFKEISPEQIVAREEEEKIMEESLGDPRYADQFPEQSTEKGEKKEPYEVPRGEHPIDKYQEKINQEFMHPLAGLTEDKVDEMLGGLMKPERGPVSEAEWKRFQENVKKTRDSQVGV